MKQLLILSGKGGTGKTTVAGAFIKLADSKAYCDCDVDAPNLHLLSFQFVDIETRDFYGMDKAFINVDECDSCDLCRTHCRFNAIFIDEQNKYVVDNFNCEGCAVCQYVCPRDAIDMLPAVAGELKIHKEKDRVFSTAQLKMGSGNSGLLVTEVKNRMKKAAPKSTKLAILDGSPGIGCPVIASVSGVDMALIVTEPSISGISDMERIVKTANRLNVPIAICVNKSDTNPEGTVEIKNFCEEEGIAFVGTIPYDIQAVKAINAGKTVVEIPCPSGRAIEAVYEETIKLLFEGNKQEAEK